MAVSISACFATPVKALPSPTNAVAFTVPFTSNFCDGLVVPIPTFPLSLKVTLFNSMLTS